MPRVRLEVADDVHPAVERKDCKACAGGGFPVVCKLLESWSPETRRTCGLEICLVELATGVVADFSRKRAAEAVCGKQTDEHP